MRKIIFLVVIVVVDNVVVSVEFTCQLVFLLSALLIVHQVLAFKLEKSLNCGGSVDEFRSNSLTS